MFENAKNTLVLFSILKRGLRDYYQILAGVPSNRIHNDLPVPKTLRPDPNDANQKRFNTSRQVYYATARYGKQFHNRSEDEGWFHALYYVVFQPDF